MAPRWLLVLAAAAAAGVTVCVLWVDAPLARWLAVHGVGARPWWDGLVEAIDAVGFGGPRWLISGLVSGAALLALLVPRWRGAAPVLRVVAVTHVVARVTTGWVKDATGRRRPLEWLAHGGGDTFGWADGVAFPSGHVAYYLSLALPLAVLAPRLGRPLLAVPAVLIAARVAVDAHFASDALGAVAWVALLTWLACRGLAARPAAR